jgi:hypothetical protein
VRDEGRREKQYNFTNFSKFNFQKNVGFTFGWKWKCVDDFFNPDFCCFLGLNFVGAKNNNFTNFSKFNFQKNIEFLLGC